MKVIYEDDYGNRTYNQFVAVPGDIVTISNEDWIVKSRYYDLDNDELLISVTQKSTREKVEESDTRLNQIQRAIIEVNKRQDLQEKRTKSLREQTMSIRQHIRRNQPKPKDTQ